MLTQRTGRLTVIVLAVALMAAACSVSAPRDGFEAFGQEDGSGLGRSGSADAQNDAVANDAAVDPVDGSVASGSVVGPGSNAEAGPTVAGGSPAGGAVPGGRSNAAGSVSETAVGVTEDSITVSIVMGYSGPYGPLLNRAYEQGFGTWLNDVNSHGGIHGRKVIVKKVDHRETADGGVAACKEALSNGSFLTMVAEGLGDANFATADCLDKAASLNLGFAAAPSPRWRHTYGFVPSSVDQGISLASFVQNALGDGDKKLGVIYLSPLAYVASKDSYVAAAKALGMNVVATEAIEPNQASFTPQLLRLKNAGVENLAIVATVEAVGILRDAAALNYHPHITGMNWAFDVFAQVARSTADGATGLRYSATIDSPAFAQFQRKHQQYGNGDATDGDSLIIYGYALLLQRVLEAAGTNPTLGTLRAGIESISGYDNGILPPLTWGPGRLVGTRASFPAVCCTASYTWKAMGPARAQF